MRASDVCRRAADLVGGDRAKQHGNALETYTNIAALWSAYPQTPTTTYDVALMMVLLKIARTKPRGLNLDDFVGAVGYAGIAAELAIIDVP